MLSWHLPSPSFQQAVSQRLPWKNIVSEAWPARQAWPGVRSCTAFRILDGEADAAPRGLALDRYGACAVAWLRDDVDDAVLHGLSSALEGLEPGAEAGALVLKRLTRRIEDSESRVLSGSPPEELAVKDDGVALVARIDGGVQTGLFLDLRPAR